MQGRIMLRLLSDLFLQPVCGTVFIPNCVLIEGLYKASVFSQFSFQDLHKLVQAEKAKKQLGKPARSEF